MAIEFFINCKVVQSLPHLKPFSAPAGLGRSLPAEWQNAAGFPISSRRTEIGAK
ncbi:MAG: hypothetical protein JNL84_11115 [Candidatus Accumulibacter sp.]|nr:hypothetical protein [Accumulibacter sp.]